MPAAVSDRAGVVLCGDGVAAGVDGVCAEEFVADEFAALGVDGGVEAVAGVAAAVSAGADSAAGTDCAAGAALDTGAAGSGVLAGGGGDGAGAGAPGAFK